MRVGDPDRTVRHMRFRLVAGLAGAKIVAAAVLAAGAVGSVPTGEAALPRPTGYQAKATIQIKVRTTWYRWHPRKEACGVWFLSQGKNSINALGLVEGYVDFRRLPGDNRWANIGLHGESTDEKITFSRRWLKEESNVQWGALCIPPKPKAYKVPDNDCEPWGDKTKDRQVKVNRPLFSISASRRKSDVTLADLLDPVSEGRHKVLEVSAVTAGKGWYRNCGMQLGPADPIGLAALVEDDDLAELRALKPGENASIGYDTRESGPSRQCDDPKLLGPDAACEGWYKINIIVHRVKPGERWPRP